MKVTQVLNAIDGYSEKELEFIKAVRIIIWSPIRWLAWRLVNMSGKVLKSPINSPEQMIKFEWDKPQKISEEKKESIINSFPDKFGSR